MKLKVDHIVISVKDLKKSIKFYQSFLGKPAITEFDASWKIGDTKLFLTFPYKKSAKNFEKQNLGLNHVAFGVKSKANLIQMGNKLDKLKIKNSGIKLDTYSKKSFIWFDDPDKIRLEFYLR